MDNTPNKALEAVVRALGGSKVVAPRLWPDKTVIAAQTLLCDCLNDDRPAKLDFGQVLYILRMAKERGIHDGMEYVCTELGYAAPQPIEPRDELAELQRQNAELLQAVLRNQHRMERVTAPAVSLRSAA